MEKCRLDFNKYKERLSAVFPTYSEKELEDFFIYQVRYLEILVESVEGDYLKYLGVARGEGCLNN